MCLCAMDEMCSKNYLLPHCPLFFYVENESNWLRKAFNRRVSLITGYLEAICRFVSLIMKKLKWTGDF